MSLLFAAFKRALKDPDNVVGALATCGACTTIALITGLAVGWGLVLTAIIVSYGIDTVGEYIQGGARDAQ